MNSGLNKYYVLNYVVLIGILLLFVNDHYLKDILANGFTGKLSDFLGVLLLPFLLMYFFPKNAKFSLLLTALFFVFWKSPYSQGLIETYNRFAPIRITRVLDDTDLWALLMLPVSYMLIRHVQDSSKLHLQKCRVHAGLVLIPISIVLLATSPPRDSYYTYSGANIKCGNCSFKVPLSQQQILEKLAHKNVVFDSVIAMDSLAKEIYGFHGEEINFYKLNFLALETDTLKNLDFSMRTPIDGETEVYFTGFDYKEEVTQPLKQRKLRRRFGDRVLTYLKDRM